jgi:hypothetical protein
MSENEAGPYLELTVKAYFESGRHWWVVSKGSRSQSLDTIALVTALIRDILFTACPPTGARSARD